MEEAACVAIAVFRGGGGLTCGGDGSGFCPTGGGREVATGLGGVGGR
ncbi:hypothetical protein Acr_08g0015410 [Actinidia rufa]|uniref:Uncharacterized protein n=1 Tax=Actinidia rufa TaxID=165716 RepID=A0A7J0F374_9ERIC|nr:hypothetical protein Acr_08g0015410 [Actinidia rufa]